MSQLAASILASVHTDASADLCPPPEQTRSAMHKPTGLSKRSRPGRSSVSIIEQALVNAPPVVFYIDKQRLGRDCVSEQLATHLSKWAIESLASIREVPSDEDWSGLSVVILNTHGASLSTAEVADEMKAIAETAPGAPLLVMSDLDEATEVLMAMQLGARGFLPTGLPFSQAVAAIRLVGDGGTYIPVCVLAASSEVRRTSPTRPVDGSGKPIEFSPRQLQVLERLRQGKQNKMIAYELGMCESTVKVHIRHIMRKLNARNRTQVVLLTQDTSNRPAAAFAV
jgi:DNA-binding NarL/FixJ family response regulator